MVAGGFEKRTLAWLLAFLALTGCAGSGSIRGATSVVIAVKGCPEVTGLIAAEGADWAVSLGLDPGDAATLKEGFAASKQLEANATDIDSKLKDACSGLASDLGTPIVAATGDEACTRASEVLTQEKAKLGSEATVEAKRVAQCEPGCKDPCDVSAPTGPCAKTTTVTVQVSGAADAEAAARYKSALDVFLPLLAAAADTESNVRGVIANARAAVELGLVTGRAVSDGDVAAAASAAVCILPPLLSAKQRIAGLRKDLRALGEIAHLSGLEIPRPDLVEAPIAHHTEVGRGQPPIVPAPLSTRIENLFAFPDGGFAAQTKGTLVALPGGELILNADQHGSGEALGQLYCSVGPGHSAACIRSVDLFNNQGKHLGSQIRLYDSASGMQTVANASGNDQLVPDGIGFDSAGTVLYAYTLTQVGNNQSNVQSLLVRGGQQTVLPWHPQEASLEDLGSGGRSDPPIRFFEFLGREQLLHRDGRTLLLTPIDQLGMASHVAERTAYDSRPVVGGDGLLYVFYYEPKSRTARVAHSSDGVTFSDLILDTRESGWQLDAIPTDDGALSVYYYFRNTYNKGLRTAQLKGGRLVHPPASIMREDRWNAGWHVNLVSDHGHDVWLTYLSNVENDTRVWSHFAAPSELLDYAMLDNNTSEDSYKDWFVQAGAGVWYTFWALKSKAPDAAEVDGTQLHSSSYKIDPALLLTANLEARVGPVDAGLSYSQNYLDKAAKSLGNTTRVLSGEVKIDDLLPGHDVKVEGVWGRYHGTATRDVDGAPADQMDVDTSYVDIHLFALNQWRIKYGLAFTKYSVPTPVQAYYVAANDTHYSFATSALRNVHYNDIELALGYSKLDYVAKYENSYFGPIADATIAGGVSLTTFDAISTPEGDVTSGFGLHARANVLLGWLWMDRFRALDGLGLYVRPSYAIEGGFSGLGLSRPKDRDAKDAAKSDTESTFSLLSLRHGPWLDAGIVW
jgi:hypothetical protein